MKTALSDQMGVKYPIFGFSPEPEVVVAISNAGGVGVLGAASLTPDGLDEALSYIEDSVGDRPYGVDVIMPMTTAEQQAADQEKLIADLVAAIPEKHWQFVESLLDRFGVPAIDVDSGDTVHAGTFTHLVARAQLEKAFEHRPKLLVNALGPFPADVAQRARDAGMATAALAGNPRHARRHVEAGADLIVSTGYEAAGHTGDIAGMVAHAEISAAVAPIPVLASGAMATGRQAVAAIALGALGIWCGSVWLLTEEARRGNHPIFGGRDDIQQDYLRATSSDTVRTRWATGKPARLLRTAWSDAWEADDSPGTLPMPLQAVLVDEAQRRIAAARRTDLSFKPAGQVIGMLNEIKPVSTVIEEIVNEYAQVVTRLAATTDVVGAHPQPLGAERHI